MALRDTHGPQTPRDELGELFTRAATWVGKGRYAASFGAHQGREAIAAMLGAYAGPPPHFTLNAHLLGSETIRVREQAVDGEWVMLECSAYANGRSDLRAARLSVGFEQEDGALRTGRFETENLFSRPIDRWDDPAPIPVPSSDRAR